MNSRLLIALLAMALGVLPPRALAQEAIPDPATALAQLHALRQTASKRLVPISLRHSSAMETWLESARVLVKRRSHYANQLRDLRTRALPYEATQREADEAACDGSHKRIEQLRKQSAAWQGAIDATKKSGQLTESVKAWCFELKVRIARNNRLIQDLQDTLGRRTWNFAEPTQQALHEALVRVLEGIDSLLEKDLAGATLAGMEFRIAAARSAPAWDEPKVTASWQEARQAIKKSPSYGGLDLPPQAGLVPLGPDPASGLQEFAVATTGSIPTREARTGALILDPGMAVTLILVPGGSLLMGAQKYKPGRPRFDPSAAPVEYPVHRVALDAYFLSKFEMTQGQWARVTGRWPARFMPGSWRVGVTTTALHPVESVSQPRCLQVMRLLGLTLPTEAQWEHAARAGTDTAWWTGDDVKTIRGAANVADTACSVIRKDLTVNLWLNDGYAVHASAGATRANPWGFHEVIGNVWEWCLDRFGSYKDPVAAGTGLRQSTREIGIKRGGGFIHLAIKSRSSYRGRELQLNERIWLGLRPARAITRR